MPEQFWGYVTAISVALATGIFGTGGIAAFKKARDDKRLGVRAQESTEDDALAGRWQSLIETQTTALLAPMAKRLAEVEAEVKRLDEAVKAERRKYWQAVGYIRTVLAWIRGHNLSSKYPDPPAGIAEDI